VDPGSWLGIHSGWRAGDETLGLMRTAWMITLGLLMLGCPGSDSGAGGEAGTASGIDGSGGIATTRGDSAGTSAGTVGADGSASGGESDSGSAVPTGSSGGVATDTAADSGGAETGATECVESLCDGDVWACGDCIDNDGDGLIDTLDTDCFGPCDNNESGWSGEIPGQDQKCKQDCYFDENSGAGNDECTWTHECDPLEPSVLTDPNCTYDPDAGIAGTQMSCAEAFKMQSETCLDVCLPLVPNGCDCFGCCEVGYGDGESISVYLGTENDDGDGTCNLDNLLDPVACAVCTQVPGCFNPCVEEECELCFAGELPEDCDEPGCPPGIQSCMETADCPMGLNCLTGCCFPQPG